MPMDIINSCKVRIGYKGNGGYILLDKDLDNIDVIYSIGD